MGTFQKTPLGGTLGLRTAAFYRVDRNSGLPIAKIGDLLPALGPDRVTYDAIDSETVSQGFAVTTNALQDLSSATSNVHRDLIRVSLTGTLISSIDLGLIGSVGLGGVPGFGGGLRTDLLKLANLEALADAREPIAVITPRLSLPLAFIESIDRDWSPDIGENTIVSISLVEARIVNPLSAESEVPDVAASNTGNNSATATGNQIGREIITQSVTPPPVGGAAPGVIPL